MFLMLECRIYSWGLFFILRLELVWGNFMLIGLFWNVFVFLFIEDLLELLMTES